VPAIIAAAGGKASEHFLEILCRHDPQQEHARGVRHRRRAVLRLVPGQRPAARRHSSAARLRLYRIHGNEPPSIKQHLAALRGLFNWLVIKQVVPETPALFVKGPKFSCQIGITPTMEADQMRQLLDSIPVMRKVKVPRKHGGEHQEAVDIKGLRDRAAIGIMAYTFARVSAVEGLRLGDYRMEGKHSRLRLIEEGNKEILIWLHREAEEPLHTYIKEAGISGAHAPLFQSLDKVHRFTGDAILRWDIVKSRCKAAGLSEEFCNHTFRGTGITVFLQNGGSLEAAQDMANHSDPRTTKLYDRREDLATLSEIERRIAFE
jgi:integrase/recombinase XerD